MLYHLSEENHNGEVFTPRVPTNVAETGYGTVIEDNKHKRVCFATTISGAYRAIQFDEYHWMELYVHVPVKKRCEVL